MNSKVRHLEQNQIDLEAYDKHYVGCVILTHDHKILLQQRPDTWHTYPGYQCEFGGHIEPHESPKLAIIRELHEELGARASEDELMPLGAITEAMTNHTQVIFIYFWHDKKASITGCYEGSANTYDSVDDALTHPKMTDSVKWLLAECHRLGLI